MASSDETIKSLAAANTTLPVAVTRAHSGAAVIFRKTSRTVLLTFILALLPLVNTRLGEKLSFKGQTYREMLPSARELISFGGATHSGGELPGGSAQNDVPVAEVIEPPAGAGSIVDPDRALDAFYEKLASTDGKKPGAITRIAHYGDSPITNDGLTAPTRRLLQQRFGDAGHGFILLDRPWEWYGHQAITFSSGGGWNDDTLMNPMTTDGAFGLGGVNIRASGAGKYARFGPATEGDNGKQFSRMDVYFLRQPNGGTFQAAVVGGNQQSVSTSGDKTESGFFELAAAQNGANTFEVRSMSGSVRFFGAVIENDGPGIVYDSLGVNGAYAGLLATVMNEKHWGEQLQHRNPDLIILNYGTNESQYASDAQMARYDRDLREVVRRIRSALPRVSIMIVSPMDRGTHSGGKVITLASIPKIVELQRRVAEETNCAFFNLFAAMGGEGTMARWHEGRNHMVGGDLTHPTTAGAEKIGELIYNAIVDGYSRYQARQRVNPKVTDTQNGN